MTLRDALKDDLARMEDVCVKTAEFTGKQGRYLYWCAVAIFHILQWIVRKNDGSA